MHDDMQHNRDIDDDDDMRAPPEEVPEPKSGKLKTHFPQSSNFMDELMSLKKSKSMTRATGKNYQTQNSGVEKISVEKVTEEKEVTYRTQERGAEEEEKDMGEEKKTLTDVERSGTAAEIEAEMDNFDDVNELVPDTKREEYENRDAPSLARVVPSIKNSGVTMRTSVNLNLYARPGPIENHDLLQKRNCLLLKNNLIEHHNFVALPPLIWKHIYSWYDADWLIVRFLRRDSAQGVILDLYPMHYEERNETVHMDTDGEGALATAE